MFYIIKKIIIITDQTVRYFDKRNLYSNFKYLFNVIIYKIINNSVKWYVFIISVQSYKCKFAQQSKRYYI